MKNLKERVYPLYFQEESGQNVSQDDNKDKSDENEDEDENEDKNEPKAQQQLPNSPTLAALYKSVKRRHDDYVSPFYRTHYTVHNLEIRLYCII